MFDPWTPQFHVILEIIPDMSIFFRSGNKANTHGKAERHEIELVMCETSDISYHNQISSSGW